MTRARGALGHPFPPSFFLWGMGVVSTAHSPPPSPSPPLPASPRTGAAAAVVAVRAGRGRERQPGSNRRGGRVGAAADAQRGRSAAGEVGACVGRGRPPRRGAACRGSPGRLAAAVVVTSCGESSRTGSSGALGGDMACHVAAARGKRGVGGWRPQRACPAAPDVGLLAGWRAGGSRAERARVQRLANDDVRWSTKKQRKTLTSWTTATRREEGPTEAALRVIRLSCEGHKRNRTAGPHHVAARVVREGGETEMAWAASRGVQCTTSTGEMYRASAKRVSARVCRYRRRQPLSVSTKGGSS